jgi:hypothetical protein
VGDLKEHAYLHLVASPPVAASRRLTPTLHHSRHHLARQLRPLPPVLTPSATSHRSHLSVASYRAAVTATAGRATFGLRLGRLGRAASAFWPEKRSRPPIHGRESLGPESALYYSHNFQFPNSFIRLKFQKIC